MPVGQIILITLGAIAVARAFITLGHLSYRLKWLNYLVALVAALGSSRFFIELQLLPLNVLLVSLICGAAALLIYQFLRMRLGAAEAGL